MRVGFDTSPLCRPHPPGIVRAVGATMDALERLPGFTALRCAPEAGESLRLWRQLRLPRLVGERGLDGLHSFVSAFALTGPGWRVQTVHELPWRHGVRENAGLAHRFWAGLASRRADRVLCATEFVARELAGAAAAGRVRVAPWGVDAARFGAPPAEGALRELRARCGVDGPSAPALIAAPGAARRKKNLESLLRGAAELARRGGPSVRIAVTGADGAEARADQDLARALGLAERVVWLGVLDEALLHALLHASAAVALLSQSEGFGLPVLESFAAGRGAIVARASSQSEVAAGLGCEADPADPRSVADALERVLGDGARAELRRAHAAQCTWDRTAQQIAAVWRELAQ